MIINKKMYLLIAMFFVIQKVSAKEEIISRTFPLNSLTELRVENKYGKIKVENSTKNTIEIIVTIGIESNNKNTEEKILNNIDIKFYEGENTLIAKTEWGRFFTFMKMSNSLFRGGNLAVDYLIKAPKNIAMDLKLSYGDIILYERNGDVKLNLQDGLLSSEALNGTNDIVLRGANAKILEANRLKINMKSGKIGIDKVGELLADTYNVTMKVREVRSVNAQSIRDNVYFGKILGKTLFDANMTHVTVEEIKGSSLFSANYGSVKLKKLGNAFNRLKINARSTDINLGLEGVGANIAINHHQSTKMDVNKSLNLQMSFGDDNKNFISTGHTKQDPQNNKIMIDCKGGNLILD